MEVRNVSLIDKAPGICKFDIFLPEHSMTIKDCKLLSGKHGQWVSFPSRQYKDKVTGQDKFFSYIQLDNQAKSAFEGKIKLLLKPYLDKAPEEPLF